MVTAWPAAGQGFHVRLARPAGAHLPRRTMRGVRRAVVLSAGQQLRDEDEEDHLPRRLGVAARSATRAQGDDEHRGKLSHRP